VFTTIAHINLLVKDYDETIAFYTQKLGFVVISNSDMPEMGEGMKWVVVAPSETSQIKIAICKATREPSLSLVGKQGGGYPLFNIYTNDVEQEVTNFKEKGVGVVMEIRNVEWGKYTMLKISMVT
jgi:catechol 2,3-dioxygenase-like lactoylglutathione lyase family enzyme